MRDGSAEQRRDEGRNALHDRSQRPNEGTDAGPTPQRPHGASQRADAGPAREEAGADPASAPRERDPWLPSKEPYAGAAALDDLAGAEGDPGATRRVLARYAAVRLVRRAATGLLDDEGLEYDRRVAVEYVAVVGPPSDAERRALARTIALAERTDAPALWAALTDAAELAEACGACRGAYVLRRTVFELASRASHSDRAEGAARAVARLAEANGASAQALQWWRGRAVGAVRRQAGAQANRDALGDDQLRQR